MKQINSVLLPGEFFKNNFLEKTQKLMSLDIDTVYLFDHGINPAGKNLDVYELIDGINKAGNKQALRHIFDTKLDIKLGFLSKILELKSDEKKIQKDMFTKWSAEMQKNQEQNFCLHTLRY